MRNRKRLLIFLTILVLIVAGSIYYFTDNVGDITHQENLGAGEGQEAEYGTQPDSIVDNEAYDGIVDNSGSEIIDEEGLTDDNNIVEEQPVEDVKPIENVKPDPVKPDPVKPDPVKPTPKPDPKPEPIKPAPKPDPEKQAPEQGSGTDVTSGTATGEHGRRPGTEADKVAPEDKATDNPDGAW